MSGLLNSKEITGIMEEARKKLNCEALKMETYQGEYNCPDYGYPKKGVFSSQAFIKRTILCFRVVGQSVGLKYMNGVWQEWNGKFPLNEQHFN